MSSSIAGWVGSADLTRLLTLHCRMQGNCRAPPYRRVAAQPRGGSDAEMTWAAHCARRRGADMRQGRPAEGDGCTHLPGGRPAARAGLPRRRALVQGLLRRRRAPRRRGLRRRHPLRLAGAHWGCYTLLSPSTPFSPHFLCHRSCQQVMTTAPWACMQCGLVTMHEWLWAVLGHGWAC